MAGDAVVKLPSTKGTRTKKSTKQNQEAFTLISPTGWNNIPEELLASIFHLVKPNDMSSLRGVCTNWKRVIEIDKSLSTKLKYIFNSVESFQTAVTSVNIFGAFPFSSVSFKTDSVGYKSESAKTFFKTTHPQVLHLELTKKSENNHAIPPTTIQSIVRLFPNLKYVKLDDFTSTFMKYLVEKVSQRATMQLLKIFENITVFKLTCSFHVHHSINKAFNPQQFEILLRKLPQLNTLLYKRENTFGYFGSRAPVTQQRDMEILKGIYSHMKKYPRVLKIISFDVPVMVTKLQTDTPGFSILNLFHMASEYGIIIKNYYFPLEELLQATEQQPNNTNTNVNPTNNNDDNNNNMIMRNPQDLPLNKLNFQSIQNASFRITSTGVYSSKAWDLILKCSALKCLILIIDSDPVTDLSFLKYFPALRKLNLKIVSRPISSVEEAIFQSQLFEQKLFPLESFELDQRSTFYANGRRVQNLFASQACFLRFCETYSQLQELALINCPCGTDYYCIGIILSCMKSLRILKLEGVGDSDNTFIKEVPRSFEERIITINNQLTSISPMYEGIMTARMEKQYGCVKQLQQLELKGMNFTDISVHDFISGLSLKSLFIRNCSNITDLSLRAIASVGPLRKTLKHFKIFGSSCTILGLDALIKNCENLTCVEFQCPNIKAAGFIEYANSAYMGRTTVKLASD